MKLSKDLRIIYVFAIIWSLVLIVGWGYRESPDSVTYVSAWDSLVNGQIDIFRTPTYPIFLGICKFIFGVGVFKFIAIIFQHLFFLVSIYYYQQIVKSFIRSNKVCFWLTLIYAILPCIIDWNNYILTESFAIVGMVFLAYNTIKVYKQVSVISSLGFLFWLLFLIFLRPSFLYLLPVMFLFWFVLLFLGKKKGSCVGIICTCIIFLCQLAYVYQMEQVYGVFTPSSVSVINQYYMIRQNGLVYVEGIENETLRNEIKNGIEEEGIATDNYQFLWGETNRLIEKYPLEDVQQIISVSFKANPVGVIKKAGGRAYKAASFPLCITLLPGFSTLFDMIGVSINFLYLFFIIYAIIIVCWVVKKRQIPVLSCLFFLLGLSNLITVIIGAQSEWSRLILPSMPLYLLMFGQLCTMFKVKSSLSIDFK